MVSTELEGRAGRIEGKPARTREFDHACGRNYRRTRNEEPVARIRQ
jgi:hypothetical protein